MQLEVVLSRWRECRDPKLSKLIVELGGAPDPAAAEPYEGLKSAALVAKLCLELQQGERLSSLIPLVDRLVRTARGSWPVVELLAELPADPRFAYLALQLLADFGTLPHTSAKLWRRLLDTVERHGDPSCIAPLQAIDVPDSTVRPRIANIAKRLAKATAISEEQLADLRTARAPAPSTNGSDLLAAIYADPASDDARVIYADWLTSQGDPRGEFILLQLQRAAGTTTPAGERREAALLKKHAKAWLGALAPVIDPNSYAPDYVALPTELVVPMPSLRRVSFSRGFVRHVPSLFVRKHRAAVLEDPIWSTVEHVEQVDALTAPMHAVTIVDVANLDMLADPRVFERVGLTLTTNISVFEKCRVRHLELFVSYSDAPNVPACIRAATHDNPILTRITLKQGAPRQWELLWDFRLLDLRYIESVTIETNPGTLVIEPRADHLTIDPSYGDSQHWSWILRPLRTFKSIAILPGRSADEVELLVRQIELAPAITRRS